MAQATKRVDMIMTPEEAQNCNKTVHPNRMTYTDTEGKEHDIHMPKGTWETALKHFIDKNYTELAISPTWDNQKYTEDDVVETEQ